MSITRRINRLVIALAITVATLWTIARFASEPSRKAGEEMGTQQLGINESQTRESKQNDFAHRPSTLPRKVRSSDHVPEWEHALYGRGLSAFDTEYLRGLEVGMTFDRYEVRGDPRDVVTHQSVLGYSRAYTYQRGMLKYGYGSRVNEVIGIEYYGNPWTVVVDGRGKVISITH